MPPVANIRDARHPGDYHRGRDGRGAVRPGGDDAGDVAPADLGDGVAALPEKPYLAGGQAGLEPAADDGYRRGNGAGRAHRRLDGNRGLGVARVRHAVRNDGRFEGDDGRTASKRLDQLVAHVKKGVH